ncbi:hypothetical protein [Bradyrhizobium betae]|uniref:Uncharacterized protein n=1 Tax=Bradyrhizobium betae TaxID=244734 RepID=A0A4V1P6T8_9BRAD|nr:hypothetical protein [Bradyrhizobium betae]RXT48759.1 hypothetical protein B5V03_12715 [Bradyrhizobium betae]
MRSEARREIDRLIQFLDRSDQYVMTELEDEDEREDIGEAEPSLGSFDRMVNQLNSYRQGGMWTVPDIDAEQDDADAEPSLGFLENHPHATHGSLHFASRDQSGSQLRPCQGAGFELEEQCEDEGDTSDSGIADEEGRMEQCPRLFQHSMKRVE